MAVIFYKPHNAWAADFIPFYHLGQYHLFYLQDWRNAAQYGEGTPWYQVSTRDFVNFTEHGEMLPRGTPDQQDLYVFTGSVIDGLGRYHIFYTGHNPYLRKAGRPEQGVMHAISDDLLTWRKLPEETFFAAQEQYEMHDWRDPYVFWNDQAGEYWMLLAARHKNGLSRRRGCTALCSSTDLQHWHVREPFYSPGLYYTHECPDLFRIGEWWYLVFSEFSERLVTRYRMARSINGPWITPDDDQFDGRAFYAAKTASDSKKRYLFGWNPTREGETDHGAWQWGGNLVVHELAQQADGTLRIRLPEPVNQAFGVLKPVRLSPAVGNGVQKGHEFHLDAQGTFACASGGAMPERCKISVTLAFEDKSRAGGIMLRASDDWEQAYYIRIEPANSRIVFDMWPRPGDKPYMPELERPLSMTMGESVQVTVLVDGTLCEVYVNEHIAMSTRLYDLQRGQWGVFAQDAGMTCTDIGWC